MKPETYAARHAAKMAERAREQAEREYAEEMHQRAFELAHVDHPFGGVLHPAPAFALDMEMFEAAMWALLSSNLETDCWAPEAAAPFAALLVRIAEQTAAEFGPMAAGLAFRKMGELMERSNGP